jgi:hypothetical protein
VVKNCKTRAAEGPWLDVAEAGRPWSCPIRVVLLMLVLRITYRTYTLEAQKGQHCVRSLYLFYDFCHNELLPLIVLGFVLGSFSIRCVAIFIQAVILDRP